MKLRAGAFAVQTLEVIEVLSVDVHEAAPIPRPTREVPMFTRQLEPRVRVSTDLESKIRAMCFTAEGEGG
jgi:hypothetical protein